MKRCIYDVVNASVEHFSIKLQNLFEVRVRASLLWFQLKKSQSKNLEQINFFSNKSRAAQTIDASKLSFMAGNTEHLLYKPQSIWFIKIGFYHFVYYFPADPEFRFSFFPLFNIALIFLVSFLRNDHTILYVLHSFINAVFTLSCPARCLFIDRFPLPKYSIYGNKLS